MGAPLTFASSDITTDTKFAWGSITKMWTGASIMQLVARGDLSLDEAMAPYVDDLFASMKESGAWPNMSFERLADLYGPKVADVTIRHLLSMRSGIPDYDTATPSANGSDTDAFRAEVYANKNHDYSVPALLSVPWVAKGKLDFPPGTKGFAYSSTNFELLGMILASKRGLSDYTQFNQSVFVPEALAPVAKDVDWGTRGSPADHGVVAGYDRTTYNGQDPNKTGGIPVGAVHGVFAGWSAADFVGPPRAVAELGYALWGNASELVPPKYRDMMVPQAIARFPLGFYGLASQNVALIGVTNGKYAAYGHLGATYGYDSIMGYVPEFDIAIAVATNIETRTQTQPSDAYCHAFNRVKNFILNEPVQQCTWTVSSYFGGKCECEDRGATLFV